MADFSVITELKVSVTKVGGLDYGDVLRDFRKLAAILDAAEAQHPSKPLPAAYVGVFANRHKPRFDFALLERKVRDAGIRPDVRLLKFEA